MFWTIVSVLTAVFIGSAYFANRTFARLQRENQRLVAEALEAVQMKKEFVSRASHELKAPLASMQETTHLLLELIPGPLTDKQRRLLELNFQSGKRLSGMIGNMLDLSRLESGIAGFDMHEQDIRDLLHNIVLEHSAEAREKTLKVQTDIDSAPIFVRGDAPRLSQLFSNILDNAIKFSPEGGTIHLRATVRDAGIVVSITDNGPGVEASEKKKIFEALSPMAARKNKARSQGFGLGLAIARAIADAHGGIIALADNPAGGSVFSVLLPGPKGGLVADRLNDLHLDIA